MCVVAVLLSQLDVFCRDIKYMEITAYTSSNIFWYHLMQSMKGIYFLFSSDNIYTKMWTIQNFNKNYIHFMKFFFL